MTQSVSFIFSYESYLKAIVPIAEYFIDNGYKVNLYLYRLGNGTKQVENLEGVEQRFKTKISSFRQLEEINIADDKAVFFGLGGNDLRKLINQLKSSCERHLKTRPLSISLYSGIRAPLQYDGFISRMESDIILFNNQPDLDEYNFFCNSMGVKPENGMLFGLSVLKDCFQPRDNTIKKVTFIEQTIHPKSKIQRYYLLTKLFEYAENFPDRELTILMRDISNNTSAHKSKYPIGNIVNSLRKEGYVIPSNLEISTERLSKVIKETNLCITISSTVSLEAISLGIKTALINDFGFSSELGNCGYIDSGYIASFNDLIQDKIPTGNRQWIEKNIITIEKSLPKLKDVIENRKSFNSIDSNISQNLLEFDRFKDTFKNKNLKNKLYYSISQLYNKLTNRYKHQINRHRNK